MVERLGFVWRPDVGARGAYATDDVAAALALLDLKQVSVVADRGVEDEIRSVATAISVTGEITKIVAADDAISVTAEVAKMPRVEMEAPALDPATTMESIPVTVGVTENIPADDAVSVTADDTETPLKRKRGRPPKAEGAMTAAERARRYREKHRQEWKPRRVDLWKSTVERAEKLAAERGSTVTSVIDQALDERAVRLWGDEFERVKAAAAKSGEDMELIVNSALTRINESEWDEIAAGWLRYRAKKAKGTQPEMTGV
ncbi:hypothetical protein [Agrobacterium tumefaciens]|uniref:hypothetical protein n=1 Tax=Agrobacterium tumefaciens TaxID=358 RepID=UPI000DDAED38|nr:hypothetical protein [Agrobacterium tumefaciens]